MDLRIKICLSLSTILGIAMVVIGAFMFAAVFPSIIISEIDESLVLKNNTEALGRFEEPSVPTYLKFYFFNVTNKDEVNANGAKAVLEETGPYVYRKEIIRVISTWNNTAGTVTYSENTTYYFEPKKSSGSLQDLINHVNMVSVGMISSPQLGLLETVSGTKKTEMITNAPGNLVESHTVDELLFRGFDISKYLPPFNTTYIGLKDVCAFQDNCTFAFYLNQNESLSKSFEVKTGMPPSSSSETLEEAMKQYREILGYDGYRSLKYWSGPTCNAINGTDGTQFPPAVDRQKELNIFITEVCRSMEIVYEKNVKTSGINGLRFILPPRVYAAPTKSPDNWCFFSNDTSKYIKERSGLLNVSTCYDDTPVMASAPHFYMGDQEYVDDFVGLHPQKDLHESFIDVEPMSGVTISAAKRLQINIVVEPDPRPKFLKYIKKTLVFPVFWADESGQIDEETASMLKDQLITPYEAGKWSLVAIIVLGSLMLTITFGALVKMAMRRRRGLSHNLGNVISRVGEKNYNSTLNNSKDMKGQKFSPAGEKE